MEAYAGSKAAKLAELEGMQLASRPSNRAGLDPAALAALEQQVGMCSCMEAALRDLHILANMSTAGCQGVMTACQEEAVLMVSGLSTLPWKMV